jgi:hypothetical protein
MAITTRGPEMVLGRFRGIAEGGSTWGRLVPVVNDAVDGAHSAACAKDDCVKAQPL